MLPDDPALPLGTSESAMGAGLMSVIERGGTVIAIGLTEVEGALVVIGTRPAPPAP